jgi:hypothetical protein
MLTPDYAEARRGEAQDDETRGPTKITILLPVNRVLRDSAVIDRVIAAVFDRLGHTAVELRVSDEPEE